MTLRRSVLATKYLRVGYTVRNELDQPVDPTLLPVEMALTVPGTAPVEDDWAEADWEAVGPPSILRCLVGPDGSIVKTAGVWSVWIRIDNPPQEILELVDELILEPPAVGLEPLASLSAFYARLGYAPEGAEEARAAQLLDEASALIRDEAGDDADFDPVPGRIASICISVAYRAFTNPEPLNQHTLGDENKGFDRAAVGGGEIVYLTKGEQRAVKKAGGGSSFRSVPLVSPFSGDDEVLEIIQTS